MPFDPRRWPNAVTIAWLIAERMGWGWKRTGEANHKMPALSEEGWQPSVSNDRGQRSRLRTMGEPMKRILAIFALFFATSAAQSAENQFVGGFEVVAISGTCPNGTSVGERYIARFRPRNTTNNNPHSDFNLFSQSFAEGYRLPNHSFTTGFQKVEYTSIGGGTGGFDLTNSTSFIRFVSQTPASITATTPYVYVAGQIQGFNGDQPSCTVTFRFAGVKRT